MKLNYISLLFIIFLCKSTNLNAQNEAKIWYFGANAGLDFNTNPPTVLINSAMNANEGCASISDNNGNILFYTDGETIWNKTHSIMANGTGLIVKREFLFSRASSVKIDISALDNGFYNCFVINGKQLFSKSFLIAK